MNEAIIQIPFDNVNEVTIGELYRSKPESLVCIIVHDETFGDTFTIKLQKTNLGISGMCFLGNQPSYQADFKAGGSKKLKEIINLISGGEVLNI